MIDDQNQVFAVILAGGSGTRFWPASRRNTPKQLLPLAPDSKQSLLRQTVSRLEPLIARERVYISTGLHLLEATRSELPELSRAAFLAEPEAKNTAPCIAWAAQVIAARDPDAVICVLPSDQHAASDEGFRASLRDAVSCARKGAIVTIGIVPTRPETGYGYVRRGAAQGEGYAVDGFYEKPNLAQAESYLKDGNFLWNAGIFVFRARDMVAAVERHLPEVNRAWSEVTRVSQSDEEAYSAAIAGYFRACPKISIDYGVMEKEQGLMVVPGDFGWSDLGSWQSAWELAGKDDAENVATQGTVLIDARRNLVKDLRVAGSQKVIALVGVDDLCVVETEDALLILPRERSQDVREIVEQLKATGRESLT